MATNNSINIAIPITGAASSTDNAIVRWDGTGGNVVQNSTVTVSDTGALAGLISLDSGASALTLLNNTGNTMVISAAGEITKPLQPAFLAFLGTTNTNATGDSTEYTIGSGANALTEVYDVNSDFSTSTFTAPVTGKYYLAMYIRVGNLTASHNKSFNAVLTSNRNYYVYQNPGAIKDSSSDVTLINQVLADMDAADTATFTVRIDGSTKTVSILGNSDLVTYIYGWLAT